MGIIAILLSLFSPVIASLIGYSSARSQDSQTKEFFKTQTKVKGRMRTFFILLPILVVAIFFTLKQYGYNPPAYIHLLLLGGLNGVITYYYLGHLLRSLSILPTFNLIKFSFVYAIGFYLGGIAVSWFTKLFVMGAYY